jgi:hypothetical protein
MTKLAMCCFKAHRGLSSACYEITALRQVANYDSLPNILKVKKGCDSLRKLFSGPMWILILFIISIYVIYYYICARPLSYIMYMLLKEYSVTN